MDDARSSRDKAFAVVMDHYGVNPVTDENEMSRVWRRLGWDMLTDEALELLAQGYEAEASLRDRINAENRSRLLAAGRL